jgi:beta-xylosidase
MSSLSGQVDTGSSSARNPIIWADVPDMAMISRGDTYYMSSTTMHLSPGVPIMRSKDLVNWEIINYAYDILDDVDELNLNKGKSAYGNGSWASSIRYHNGTFYVTTFSLTTARLIYIQRKTLRGGHGKLLHLNRCSTTILCFSMTMVGSI